MGKEVLSRQELGEGFMYLGERVRLVGPQGIFKPAQIREYPLSITTTTGGPYEDAFDPDGEFLRYKYRGDDPNHRENRGLRKAMHDRIPLVYFHSTVPAQYIAVWPVFIVHDDPRGLTFTVAADDALSLRQSPEPVADDIRRGYITRQVRQRIHQRAFRDRVLSAYGSRCTVCRLRHEILLDAAHIVPDVRPEGEPVIPNGLSLCKLHHAAYDRSFFAVRPDYEIEVREDIRDERDGPMLLHGLQEIHGERIQLPRRRDHWPDPIRLDQRYESFKSYR